MTLSLMPSLTVACRVEKIGVVWISPVEKALAAAKKSEKALGVLANP